jgi:hypothetical protein
MVEPNVLVMNYDENNKSPNEDKVNFIFEKIELIKPDISFFYYDFFKPTKNKYYIFSKRQF